MTKALAALQQDYEEENRGLRLQRRDGRVLLVTNPAASQGLVEEFDRLEGPGRPIRYAITDQFMQHFGLTSLEELPPLETDGEELSAALTQG